MNINPQPAGPSDDAMFGAFIVFLGGLMCMLAGCGAFS